MYYIESPSTDPRFNLALEQHVFDHLNPQHEYFMLWRNENAVIVGKHQNTMAEINAAYVKDHGIQVVRRLSGGGAVYHDLGNVNFTFIADHDGSNFDFASFCSPVMRALESLGVTAELSGRNDMTIEGKKFSGNSQYVKHGRIMHHGTIMYDSNLEAVSQALNVPADKLISKGIQSVRSRVTNVKPYVVHPVSTREFMDRLRSFMFEEYHLHPYELNEKDLESVKSLREQRYDQWDWNIGASPACQIRKYRRVDGCGQIEIFMDVEDGVIRTLTFYGDYFSSQDPAQLAYILKGTKLEKSALCARLREIEISNYFKSLDLNTFCSLLLQ